MPKWVSTILFIMVVAAVFLYFERRRILAMEAWRGAHGFTMIDPFVPDEHPAIQHVAARVTGRKPITLQWGSVITGMSNGSRITFAEISFSPSAGQTSRWFTLAIWSDGDSRGSFDRAQPGGEDATLTGDRIRGLKVWPDGGALEIVGGHAGWLTEGLMRPGRCDELLEQVEVARRAVVGR